MNYNNKVRGSRPAGQKVFMQGGVCYNRAVPIAMASLTGAPIIVPPDPGLMGAYGVALEVAKRQKLGLLQKKDFSLKALIKRNVVYGKEFMCRGGAEKCDRKCLISMVSVEEKNFPFGGACNRYYNMQLHREDKEASNLVKERYSLLFHKMCSIEPPPHAPTLGLNRGSPGHPTA